MSTLPMSDDEWNNKAFIYNQILTYGFLIICSTNSEVATEHGFVSGGVKWCDKGYEGRKASLLVYY